MKDERIKVFLYKSLALMAMAAGFAPVMGLLNALFAADYALKTLWYAPLLFLVGVWHFILRGRARMVYAVAALPLYVALGLLVMPAGVPWAALLPLLVGCAVLVVTPRAAREPLGSEWSVAMWALCAFAGLIVQALLHTKGLAAKGSVVPLREALVYCYVIFVGLMLFNLNRLSMDAGVSSRGKAGISANMVRRNRGSVLLIFLVAVFLSAIKTLGRWMAVLKEWLKAAIRFILTLVEFHGIGAPPMEGDTGLEPDMMGMMGIEEVEKSPLAQWIEMLVRWVGILVAAAIACAVLWVLGKKVLQLLKWIRAKLINYMQKSSEDYEDETESIFDKEEVKKLLGDTVRSMFAPKKKEQRVRWQQLDGRGKVRYLYRMFYDRHPKHQHMTAREALLSDPTIPRAVSEGFSAVYDKARYSDHEITDREAETWKEKLKY